ncbi:hypothetical protein ABEB36_007972 [Hypothenemus hampei]|uniref:Sphingomyelin phosphodiesterase n=1 Tax=Hypothenemus hampei TaxID=57062 RepID=A0ABD1EN65_HYPHA
MNWKLIFLSSFVYYCFCVSQIVNEQVTFEIAVPDETSLLITPRLIELAQKTYTISPTNDPATGCEICEEVIGNIISLRRSNATRQVMRDYLYKLCLLYTSDGQEGCKRVDIEIDIFLYIIDHKEDLRPERFCAIYFIQYQCEDPNADDWIIPLPPHPIGNFKPDIANDDTEFVQILQLTDVHVDPLYAPGSNSQCSEPLCCESGIPDDIDKAAGYWADYDVCDMPWHTMENVLDTINQINENLNYIYFTGDIVSHRSWDTSKKNNTETIKQFLGALEKNFPNKTVFPILGNHEPHPADTYSPESVDKNSNVSSQWVLDLVAEEWSRWLPNDTQTTIKKGGYYTVLVKPGFRIIALNSNVCFRFNFWLVFENNDTYDQLKWLVDVLSQAEKNGEKVHLLSHVPTSDDFYSCSAVWSRELTKIILRFSDTITAQFNGHTHSDEFKLYFNSSKVKSVAYNGASFTTFVGNNPNYRVYQVDSKNLTVTDYSEYVFNVTATIASSSPPKWYKLYSFKDAYDLPDLTLDSLGTLYAQMISNNTDNQMVDLYYRYRSRDSDPINEKGCDLKCKQYLVCLVSAADTTESMSC